MTMPNQYKFDNLKLENNNSTMPSQYKFDNLNKPLFGDFDLGGTNAGKNTLNMGNKTPSSTFMDKLLEVVPSEKSIGSFSTVKPQYKLNPSMVDYSQYMGLSPITQRYLYGGM